MAGMDAQNSAAPARDLGNVPELSFDASEPEAFRRDVPNTEVHIVDGGHFALDTAADEIADLVDGFLTTGFCQN